MRGKQLLCAADTDNSCSYPATPAATGARQLAFREGVKKNAANAKVWSFTSPGGGGSPRVIKNLTPFLEKYFFNELVESF